MFARFWMRTSSKEKLMSINLVADVNDLKTSLLWGQPAFTIIDVRDRSTYNHSRITGAISMPLNDLESAPKHPYTESAKSTSTAKTKPNLHKR
jgi:rhodanese-related sulfurtransferase